MIISRTPMRIPLGGGGTDLPSYYSRYGGFLLSAAINSYVYLAINKRFEDSVRVSYSRTEIVDRVEDIQHPIVREAMKLLGLDGGIEIVSIADAPASTGLGSSSSFTVGLLNALHAYKREHLMPQELAEERRSLPDSESAHTAASSLFAHQRRSVSGSLISIVFRVGREKETTGR